MEEDRAVGAGKDEWAEEASAQEVSVSARRAEPAYPIKEEPPATKGHALNAGRQ